MRSGAWQALALRAKGDEFTILFEGRELFKVKDTSFREPGRVGFWTKADSVTRFDGLSVEPLAQ